MNPPEPLGRDLAARQGLSHPARPDPRSSPRINSPADHALRTDALDPRPTPLSPLAPRRAPRLGGARRKKKIDPE